MVSLVELPTELLCYLFTYVDTPSDYHQLCVIHPLFHRIGWSFTTRYTFLSRILVDDDPWESKNDDNNNNNGNNNGNSSSNNLTSPYHQLALYRSTLCRFIASSTIPLSSVYAIDLLELVPTSHFCQFTDYPNRNIKRILLQAFRAHGSHHFPHRRRQRGRIPIIITDNNNTPATTSNTATATLTIPTLVNKTTMATAVACNRHRVIGGAPRRVYYHVTLRNTTTTTTTPVTVDHDDDHPHGVKQDQDLLLSATSSTPIPLDHLSSPPRHFTGTSNNISSLFCLLHDTNTVIGFDHDQLNCHHGTLWYEDEGIITDSSWHNLLHIAEDNDDNDDDDNDSNAASSPSPSSPSPSLSMRPPAVANYRDLSSSPVGYYDVYKTSQHRGWRPCLLQTLYKCYLKQDVRKGGLKKGDYFDCVFVYEHREDDTICLEFCQWDDFRRRWMPQGFLLFAEHHIVWTS
ncbi:hypothetical protein BCR42DRAFT_409514 [Absidia repens]|uniref:F-box domain-containing protein n=1 Tax=Absidia repens TaxID=90262 RepID=A0A1X2IRC7_9FUNG|nr:hypothetical protein BCR42DRAFT_409514 [Absidia repens]